MPEIAELMIVADQLRDKMVGKKLKSIKVLPRSRYYPTKMNGHNYMENDIELDLSNGLVKYNINSEIKSITTRGKMILMEVLTENDTILFFISHLMMNGHYSFNKPKNPTLEIEICEYIGKFKSNGISELIYFADDDNKAYFKCIVTQNEYNLATREVGPDYMSGEINFEMFNTKIRSSRIRNNDICSFLLNQKWFSGIGNYLKSEILFDSYIHPKRIVGTLSCDEIQRLWNSIHKIINESYINGGCTLYTFIQPNGGIGKYIPKVYNRTIDDFGHAIIEELINDRKTYWVREIQI